MDNEEDNVARLVRFGPNPPELQRALHEWAAAALAADAQGLTEKGQPAVPREFVDDRGKRWTVQFSTYGQPDESRDDVDVRGTSRWIVVYSTPASPYPRYYHWDSSSNPPSSADAVIEARDGLAPDITILGVYERIPVESIKGKA